MRFDVFTLFPAIFDSPLKESILKRAIDAELLEVCLHNIRDYTTDKHHITDDYPYGGGGGMVMKPEPVFAAVETVLEVRDEGGAWRPTAAERRIWAGMRDEDSGIKDQKSEITNQKHLHRAAAQGAVQVSPIPIILLTPQGRPFNQSVARELSEFDRVALICGRYEGFDERIREHLVTDEISLGDYVLTGGELAALVILDAVIRLKPGVLGDPGGPLDDSHSTGLLEYPHYTRPPEFRGWKVPEVLLSGDHARIERWRREQSLWRTFARRPDLLQQAELSDSDRAILESGRLDS